MQPVILIRHSFVSFPRNAKPKVSASFQECGDSGTWTIHVGLGPRIRRESSVLAVPRTGVNPM